MEQKMISRLLFITFLIALSLGSVFAQQKPDFSGTWKLNVAKSEFGVLPAPDSRTDVITHKDPSLSAKVTAEGARGKQEFTANYTTDGKEAVNKMGEREIKSTVKWAGSSLVVSSKFVFNDADVVGEANWTLSSDGKTLTINQHYASSLGDVDQKFVFEKQESAAPATPAKAKP
jgi:hypothetical protein